MNCEQAMIAMSAYLDGELKKEEQAELTAHLAECEDCRRLLNKLRGAEDAFCEAQAEAPETLHESVMAQIRTEAKRKEKRPVHILWAAAAAAAVIVGMLAGGVWDLRELSAPGAALSLHGAVQTVKTDYQSLADAGKQPVLVLKKMPQELSGTASETLVESGEKCWHVSTEEADRLQKEYGGTRYTPKDGGKTGQTLVVVAVN